MKRDELKDLCLRYLDGDLDPAEAQAFDRLIADDAEAARLLARLSFIDNSFETTAVLANDRDTQAAQLDRLIEESPIDFDAQPNKPLLSDAAGLLGYLLLEAAKTKPAKWLASAAAVVLLAATLYLVWGPSTGPAGSEPPIAATPSEHDPDSPITNLTIVATLTAQHEAQWDDTELSPGQPLNAGQRLTLVKGSAEITTQRGAVAILEAPATIQFTDSNNAMYLHTGKLVGICEPAESKGFTVITDTAKVTDIGTVFGVECDAAGQTTVGVLSGHVALTYKASEDEPRLLKTGDVAGVSAEGLAITEPPDDAAQRFRAWGKLLRPVTVTGDALFVENMPAELDQDNELVRVYREPAGVLLEQDLRVSRTEPGLYRPMEPRGQFTVSAGMRVDSYFVHIDRPRRPISRISRTFTITFDQPVVALIVHTDLVIDSNARFGNRGTRYLKAGGLGLVSKSGFESDAPQVDSIDWSEDRKTLHVTLNVEDADQFRVLTLSP